MAALLSLSALLLGVGVAGAGAAPSAGSGWAPRVSFAGGAQVETPHSPIAVDSHGNIFSADQEANLLRIFSPDPSAGGVLLSEFSTVGGASPRDLALDPGDDTLYTTNTLAYSPPVIHRYTSDGQPSPTYTVDPGFELPEAAGIAVDPATHDLLVADPGAEGVHRYSTAGALLGTIPTPSIAPSFVAVASDGSLYVASSSGPDILHLAADGTVLGTITGVGTDLRGLAWDSAHGHIVAAVGNRLEAYSPAGQLRSDSPAQPGGIAFDPGSGLLYQATGDGSGGTIYVYEPAPYPGAETPLLSDFTGHSVHLKVEVEPGEANAGEAPAESEAWFEYCPATASCGNYAVSDLNDPNNPWVRLPEHGLSAPGVAVIEEDLTGLPARSDYLIRAVASNSKLMNVTNAVAFSTADIAPEVVTSPATDISEGSAVLTGTVNPNGFQTTYHFEYGLTSAYGSRIPVAIEAVVDASRAPRILSRTIPDLAPGTTYHFRIVAQNSVGVSYGQDQSFTTFAAGALPKRAYEQVTPIDKGGRALHLSIGFQTEPNGSSFAYSNFSGAEDSPYYSYVVRHRDQTGWHQVADLSVPLDQSFVGIAQTTTMAISEDSTRQLVATNYKLTPDPEAVQGGLNLYIQDLATGAYTFVGGNEHGDLLTFVGLPFGVERFVAGAPDFSWVVFQSISPLLPGAADGAYYRWSEENGLEILSTTPNGASVPASVAGYIFAPVRWASRDGLRVYFQEGGGSAGPIYLRLNSGQEQSPVDAGVCTEPSKACTLPVSVSEIDGKLKPATFLGASDDGRYAFFGATPDAGPQGERVQIPLTADAVGNTGNLYRYDAMTGELEFIDAEVQSAQNFIAPVGVSTDGQTVYFRNESSKIVVWRNGVIQPAAPSSGLNLSFAAISPDGRYLAYAEGTDVYLYDADSDSRACASCLAGGATGHGFLPFGEQILSNRVPRVVNNAGELFFTASGRLVAADANAKDDVYRFQDGRNTLISPGNAPYRAVFADSSADGSDVFFSTGQKLVGQDNDESPDIYDARIGGGIESQNPPPPNVCLRDDCKATPNQGPELPFGGSEAISGSGNVGAPARKRCGKGAHARKVKGKTRCVKSAKAKRKQRKADRNRRQSR